MAAVMPSWTLPGSELRNPTKATSRYPACAMEEYASKRLMLFCTSAPMLPNVMESAATAQTIQNQPGVAAAKKMRSSTAKAAALGAVDISPTTGDGAPS